jgi:hypothetical protein
MVYKSYEAAVSRDLAQPVTLLTCIPGVACCNIGWNTDEPEFGILWFSSALRPLPSSPLAIRRCIPFYSVRFQLMEAVSETVHKIN